MRSSFVALKKNMKTDWRERLEQNPNTTHRWGDIYHLIMLPMYKEPYAVVKETFQKLTASDYPSDRCIVVLATEERAGREAQQTAERIKKEFGGSFHTLITTKHPKNIQGELPGKGSNQAWAIKQVIRDVIDPDRISYENILVSVFDVDTQIDKGYFSILTYKFLTAEHPLHSSYQPVPLFLNNIFEAPALARIISFSASFWQLIQQSRPEKLTTFSSHSMPLKALVDIGFWNTDIVSEDSRIFWQCFMHYEGNWRTVPLLFPVSMDANMAPSFWQTMVNVYKQQRRWAWGAENIGFIMGSFHKSKHILSRTKRYWMFHIIEGFHSWATNSLIIFALGWLPIVLGGEEFRSTLLAYNLPEITRVIMMIAMIGIASSAVLSIALLPPKPKGFKKIHAVWYLVSWILMPFTLIIFGSIPALEAQTRLALGGRWRLDFWVTPKHR